MVSFLHPCLSGDVLTLWQWDSGRCVWQTRQGSIMYTVRFENSSFTQYSGFMLEAGQRPTFVGCMIINSVGGFSIP